MSMFRVTPVPESSKERKVSFSPDIDESYRHEVVGKVKNLMEEVSVSVINNTLSLCLPCLTPPNDIKHLLDQKNQHLICLMAGVRCPDYSDSAIIWSIR